MSEQYETPQQRHARCSRLAKEAGSKALLSDAVSREVYAKIARGWLLLASEALTPQTRKAN